MESSGIGFVGGNPSLLTHQLQAEPCRGSRRVAPVIGLIDLGYPSDLMRFIISLTASAEGDDAVGLIEKDKAVTVGKDKVVIKTTDLIIKAILLVTYL